MSEYITFVKVANTGKTLVFEVRSVSNRSVLGVVKWHGAWRQYVLFTEPHVIFNTDCLDSIITFLNGLMAARAEAKKCPGGIHTYTLVEDLEYTRMENEKCERCGKPYQELDVPRTGEGQ